MKKIILAAGLIISLLNSFVNVKACSSIFLHSNGQMVYGRNHDYYNPNSVIIYNPKNILKKGVPFPKEIIPNWTSKYASISISLMGIGFANSGMNEKGLAIGHMGLSATVYPQKDERPAIAETQYVQYILDICANVDEVIEETKKIRIVQTSHCGSHYFVADADGNTAIIEFLQGEMLVFKNEDMLYKLICNDSYEKSMNDLKNYAGFGGNMQPPEKPVHYNELFPMEAVASGATKMNNFYKNGSTDIVQSAFDIHYAMSGPDTLLDGMDMGTQYTTVFDLTNKKLYFRTLENRNIREVDFNRFEDDCSVKAKMLDIRINAMDNVNHLFTDFSSKENRKVIDRAYSTEENKPSGLMMFFIQRYANSFKCAK